MLGWLFCGLTAVGVLFGLLYTVVSLLWLYLVSFDLYLAGLLFGLVLCLRWFGWLLAIFWWFCCLRDDLLHLLVE